MISDQVTVLHCTVSLLTCPTTMGHVPRADLCVLLRFLVKIEKIQRQTDHYLSIRLETFSRGVEMSHFVGGIWCVVCAVSGTRSSINIFQNILNLKSSVTENH